MKVSELRQLGTTGVDAAKTQLELIEFQCSSERNIFDGSPENFLSKEGMPKIFFPLLANSQWKSLRCLDLPAAAGGANCPFPQATVNVKLGPLFGLYFSFSILLVFCNFFAFFGEFVGDLAKLVHNSARGSSSGWFLQKLEI